MDHEDFHALFQRHASDVHRFAWYLSGDRHQAEDIAAETFVAWTGLDPARTKTVKAYRIRPNRFRYLLGCLAPQLRHHRGDRGAVLGRFLRAFRPEAELVR